MHDDAAMRAEGATPASGPRRWLGLVDQGLGWGVEALAATLVLADIGTLFAGVVSRFLLHNPLVWSDELASMLFIWLAMLGAVIALRKGEHMRMTALVSRFGPRGQEVLEALGLVASLLFLALMLKPAYEYASDEAFITTPALEISNAWRAFALPVGLGLMMLFGLSRLLRLSTASAVVKAVVLVGLVAALLMGASGLYPLMGRLNLLVFFVGIVAACVLAGVPIAFAFGLGTFGYLSLATHTTVTVMAGRMDEGMSHLILLAVPLFVFLALPFIIRAAVTHGVATATEVSTLGIAYSVVVGLLVYRQFDLRRLWPMLVSTASLSGAILLIIGTATAMAWGLTQSGFSRSLADAMGTLPGGATMFMAASIVIFVVLGAVLEGIPAMVLFGPLLFPIARQLGIHEVHYAMVVVLSMGLGLFAPPIGVGYYAACAIGGIRPDEGMRPILAYLLALLVGIVVVAFVPALSVGLL